MTLCYSVSDFQKIYHQYESNCKLDNDVLSILQYLENNIIIPNETEFTYAASPQKPVHEWSDDGRSSTAPRRSGAGRRGGGGGGGGGHRTNVIHSAQEWNDIKNFKVTTIQKSEGMEKELNDIRGMLNKLSAKNYDTMKDNIIKSVGDFISTHQNEKRVIELVIDLACNNKIILQLYANLFVELSKSIPACLDVLTEYVEKYKDSILNIHYIDSDVDYEGFCQYNKTNDRRKSLITFLVHLMQQQDGLVSSNEILTILRWMQTLSFEYVSTENRVNEVDEITENILLIVKMVKVQCADNDLWKSEIQPALLQFSKMKSKDYKSLSMRTVFKYMDYA